MPLATHWGDGDGAWHEVARRVQSNELWGESAIERRECLAVLGFDGPARSLRFDSDEFWSVDHGWIAVTEALSAEFRRATAPVTCTMAAQTLYDALHPVGCYRVSWDGKLAPEGIEASWDEEANGWWRRVR